MTKVNFSTQTIKEVLITGVSSGLGHALALKYISMGESVYGLSRREPPDLVKVEGFNFTSLDLARHDLIPPALNRLLIGAKKLDIVLLNSGMVGKFGDMGETPLELIRSVMDVNTWSNKVILDHLFSRNLPILQVVAISTGASISGARGWNAYSISKAALNILVRLYSREIPETHFCAVAPGLVETSMLQDVLSLPGNGSHPTLDRLKKTRGTDGLVSPEEAAERLIRVIERLPGEVESGAYADARTFD